MSLSTLFSRVRFTLYVALVAVAVLGALAAFNYSNDRWGVYSEDRLHFVTDIQVNRFALKTWHVLENPTLFDCLVMGSSRVEVIDTRKLPGTCYNFTHSGGTPRDHVIALRQFMRAGIRFDRVYIGLDEFSYIQDPDIGATQKMRRPPPGGLLDRLDFHVDYLLHFPQLRDWEIFNGHQPRVINEWYVHSPQNRQPQLRQQARRIFADRKVHEERFATVQATYWGEGDFVAAAVADIVEIAALAEQHQFELTVFFNPLHHTTYLQQDLGRMERFLAGIVPVVPVLDFSGLNAFSVDNRYWLESSHFTTRLADKMLPYLLGDESLRLPFGQQLTAERLQQQLLAKYHRDATTLMRARPFDGAHLIPGPLAGGVLQAFAGGRPIKHREPPDDAVLAPKPAAGEVVGAAVGMPLAFPHLGGITRQGQYFVADGPGAEIQVAPCHRPHGARSHLVTLDIDYHAEDEMTVYSPNRQGEYSHQRRQRQFLPAGRQELFLFMRNMGCRSAAKISPFADRGHFELYSLLGYSLTRSGPLN